MHVMSVNKGLNDLLCDLDAVFEFNPSNSRWCLRGPRGDMPGRDWPWSHEGEPWSTIEVPAASLEEAEAQAIEALKAMNEM